MAEKQAAGKLNRHDAAEAAKVGAVAEVLFESVRPSLERAADTTTSQYLETLGDLPPGTGLAVGFGIRIGIALVEERGSVIQGVKIGYRWAAGKLNGGER